MGLELIFAAASLAVGVVSGAQASAQQQQAANAQKKANAIQTAQTRVTALEERRKLLREERIRRAMLTQGGINTGTEGSSGQFGAAGAMGTNVGGIVSNAAGATAANEGINMWNQKAINFDAKARETLAWGSVFQSGIQGFRGV
jgi:outer membrane lipoprotein-sorting protein